MTRQIRLPIIRSWLSNDGMVVDSFAGGGGASFGIEQALGRGPDVAVNHDAEAIAMHAANHPETKHYTESVWEVDPRKVTAGRKVELAWFSPDCKHHSKAKGGKPREQKIRGLAWVAVTWAQRVRPRLIILENVEEFQDWGPLHRTGERAGQPIKERKGETFRAFVKKLRTLGYTVEWKLLRACDFGAPTTRRRLFLIASQDVITWPQPTHGKDRAPYRTAAECIDWDIPCPSIFTRERPLADKTLARIARGIRKYVLESARPFLVHLTHGARDHSIDVPVPTVTAAHRGELALVAPYLVHRSNGERVGQEPRVYDAQEPLRTIVSQGEKFAVCAAFLAKHYGGHESTTGGKPMQVPFDTVTSIDHHSLVAVHMAKFYGTSTGTDASKPLDVVTAGGWKHALVASFLARYNGKSVGQSPDVPLGTVDTTDRYSLVTVTIDGEEYAIVDIGMRMLTPRELFRAQGFDDSYHIDPIGPSGKPLTKTAQIRMCGNSVSPVMSRALAAANVPRRAA